MNFKVIENQTYEAGRFDTKIEAIDFARKRHGRNMQRYHEVYRFSPSYGWVGQCQWKPGDCPECQRRCYPTHNIAEEAVYVCDHCDIEIPFSELDPKIEVDDPSRTSDETGDKNE